MNLEVIRPDGDLKRERWRFFLQVDFSHYSCIYLDDYAFQTKRTTRCRIWDTETHWNRTNCQFSNIPEAPLSLDVEAEARERFANLVKLMPIKR